MPTNSSAYFKRLLLNGAAFFLSAFFVASSWAQNADIPPESSDEPSLFPEDFPADGEEINNKWHSNLNELGLTGSLRSGFWSSNRLSDNNNSIGVGSLWLKYDQRFSVGLSAFVEGYAEHQGFLDSDYDISRIKEGYAHLRKGDWDIRAGKQIIAWGRTDRLNPTDNLTPRDFTLLSPEIDEDRFGVNAIKLSKVFGMYSSLTVAWIPEFEHHTTADIKLADFSFSKTKTNDSQYAIKFDQSGGDIDWSVSYMSGRDLGYDLAITGSSGGTVLVNQNYNKVETFGADLATIVGSNRYAIEMAYTRTEDNAGTNYLIKNPFLFTVVGIEHDFGNNLSAIVQGFHNHVMNYQDPRNISDSTERFVYSLSATGNGQLEQDSFGLSGRVGKKWMNETLEGELAGSMLITGHGYSVRPKLTYAISDSLKATAGYEFYGGASDTVLGARRKNKAFFSEIRYFF